jgi:hypothetical protein
MGGAMSRNKGKRGEREVIAMLQPVVSEVYEGYGMEAPKLQRNTLQSDGGGFDVVGLDWLALEVKYQETVKLDAWWAQTLAQAKPTQCPVLIYRQNKVKWKVCLFATLAAGPHQHTVAAVISVEEFRTWFRARLTQELEHAAREEAGN